MPAGSRSGREFDVPDAAEPRSIRAGIAADPVTCEISDEDLERLRPLGSGRRKTPVCIDLSPEVIEYFKAAGDDWRGRIDALLRAYVASRR